MTGPLDDLPDWEHPHLITLAEEIIANRARLSDYTDKELRRHGHALSQASRDLVDIRQTIAEADLDWRETTYGAALGRGLSEIKLERIAITKVDQTYTRAGLLVSQEIKARNRAYNDRLKVEADERRAAKAAVHEATRVRLRDPGGREVADLVLAARDALVALKTSGLVDELVAGLETALAPFEQDPV